MQGFDLRKLVELRGFEPLTPSMRTLGNEVRSGSLELVGDRSQPDGAARSRWRCCTRALYGFWLGGRGHGPSASDSGGVARPSVRAGCGIPLLTWFPICEVAWRAGRRGTVVMNVEVFSVHWPSEQIRAAVLGQSTGVRSGR
jgi:hypothetical protein